MHVCLQLVLLLAGLLCLGGHLPALQGIKGRQPAPLHAFSAEKLPRAPIELDRSLHGPTGQRLSKSGKEEPEEGQDDKPVSAEQDISPSCEPCTCSEDGAGGMVVDCTGRGLTDVPSSLPAEATQLLMANNHLSHLDSGRFSKFYRLELLDVSSNAILSMSNDTFQGVYMLKILNLHGNKLRYTPDVFTAEVLAPLRSLRHLTLHNNTDDMAEDLDYPHLALSRLPLLEDLSLDGLTNRTFGRGFFDLMNLRNLSLSGHDGFCEIASIYNDTFENLPFLHLLNLTECGLKYVDSGSFMSLRNIDTLDVSENMNLGFDLLPNLTYGLQNSNIRVLMVNNMFPALQPCVTLTIAHMQYLNSTKLEEVHLSGNSIETVEQGALLALKQNVRKLVAKGNKLLFGPYYLDLISLKNLTVINVNYFYQKSTLPDLMNIYMQQSKLYQKECGCAHASWETGTQFQMEDKTVWGHLVLKGIFPFPLPPEATAIYLSERTLGSELTHIRFTDNVLETLDASGNLFKVWKGPMENLKHLKNVNLSRNQASHWEKYFLADCTALEVLDVSQNLLSDVIARDDSGLLLENQRNLLDLGMTSNGLYSLPQLVFKSLSSLQRLYLYGNRITADGFNVSLSHMVNLTFLDLSYNALERLTASTRAMLDRLAKGGNASLWLNLNSNPLACTCGNRDFLFWLKNTPVQLFQHDKLQCVLDNGTLISLWPEVEVLDHQCVETVGLFFGSAVGSLLILVILVGLVLYRYRWKIRYIYYAARGRYRREHGALEEFRFDAFLSYAEEDADWVTGQLLPHLEAQGLRVCFHQRDFLPGRSVIANIVEAVQTSRRTVCVLSPNFLESYWCLYEMRMAIMEGLHTGRDTVLLLLYQHMCANTLPREVLSYIHTESYVEYPRDPRCLAFFYDNLSLALRQP